MTANIFMIQQEESKDQAEILNGQQEEYEDDLQQYHYDPPTKQTLQHLQGGAGPGVPAGVLHGARGAARDGAG